MKLSATITRFVYLCKLGVLLATSALCWVGAVHVSPIVWGEKSSTGVTVHGVAEAPEAERADSPSAVEEIRRICIDEYHLGELTVDVLLEKESSGGKQDRLYRFEPGQMSRALKVTKNENEARMLASSHCPLHVMGLTAREAGVHWSDLYKPDVCARTGCGYFRKQLDDANKSSATKVEKLYTAFWHYNGGRAYAEDAIQRLAMRLVDDYASVL